jgi:hypothetical protein
MFSSEKDSVGRFTILLDESIGIQNPFGVRTRIWLYF